MPRPVALGVAGSGGGGGGVPDPPPISDLRLLFRAADAVDDGGGNIISQSDLSGGGDLLPGNGSIQRLNEPTESRYGPSSNFAYLQRTSGTHVGNLSFHIRGRQVGGFVGLIGMRSNAPSALGDYVYFYYSNPNIFFATRRGGSTERSVTVSIGNIPTTSDTTMSVTVSGTTVAVYRDGASQGSGTLSGVSASPEVLGDCWDFVFSRPSNSPAYGSHIGGGSISGGAIYSKWMSPAEVLEMHNWFVANAPA